MTALSMFISYDDNLNEDSNNYDESKDTINDDKAMIIIRVGIMIMMILRIMSINE